MNASHRRKRKPAQEKENSRAGRSLTGVRLRLDSIGSPWLGARVLRSRCLSVAGLSWIERKAASALFGEPPTATYAEARDHLERCDRMRDGVCGKFDIFFVVVDGGERWWEVCVVEMWGCCEVLGCGVCRNFVIVFDHFPRISQLYNHPAHAV